MWFEYYNGFRGQFLYLLLLFCRSFVLDIAFTMHHCNASADAVCRLMQNIPSPLSPALYSPHLIYCAMRFLTLSRRPAIKWNSRIFDAQYQMLEVIENNHFALIVSFLSTKLDGQINLYESTEALCCNFADRMRIPPSIRIEIECT